MRDTIFAPATAAGVAGVSIVRISGPQAVRAAELFSFGLPKPRYAALRALWANGSLVDRALVLYFPAGQSFTGEPVVELQLHGSVAIQAIVQKELSKEATFRPAEAGEFTRRALDMGRMSLTEVEGLSDLLVAETEAQHRQAMRVFEGRLAERIAHWRASIVSLMAQIVVVIDFADEDVPDEVAEAVLSDLCALSTELRAEVSEGVQAERLREGFEVAIVGRPNAGKSTLLNAIAGREVVITSERAGTTRDVIEVRCDLDGLPVTFLDTAGLRDTDDAIELKGIEMAQNRAKRADLRVFLGELPPGVDRHNEDLVVGAKADLGVATLGRAVSGLTGQGVDQLLTDVRSVLAQRIQGNPVAVRERHRVGLSRAADLLDQAVEALQMGLGEEIVADQLTLANRQMDAIVGRVGVEEVLGEIFSAFCIGK